MEELIVKIEQWAEDRNLIEGSTYDKQLLKLIEESGELASGISKGKLEVIKDSIGDCFVVLTILARQNDFSLLRINNYEGKCLEMDKIGFFLASAIRDVSHTFLHSGFKFQFFIDTLVSIANTYNFSLKECVQYAYDQIKDRKGKMINGVFVKEDDL